MTQDIDLDSGSSTPYNLDRHAAITRIVEQGSLDGELYAIGEYKTGVVSHYAMVIPNAVPRNVVESHLKRLRDLGRIADNVNVTVWDSSDGGRLTVRSERFTLRRRHP